MDKTDLRSHAWYYASIPRQRAEELVEKDGGFLVRDCVSQPGNYVLTCMSKGTILHFVINKVRVVRHMAYPMFKVKDKNRFSCLLSWKINTKLEFQLKTNSVM